MVLRPGTASREHRSASGRGGVAAIVLAAGVSSRMGKAKPLIPLLGRPLLVHALEALRRSDVSEIVVVLGAEADRVRREIPLDGTRVVVNPEYAEGMSSSIRAGVRAADAEANAFLIVLGDQPLISPATFNALLARQATTGARVLVPTYAGVRGNPVLLHRSLSVEIESIAGDVGCRRIVAGHASEVVEVPVDDPGILVDVDTPEDFRRVEDALRDGSSLALVAADRIADAE